MAARWYIVHAYSNFEKKVAESIEEKARQKGLSHLFEKIVVPTEKVVEVRRGRKVDSERKFFPGYVMVRANLTDDAYHLVKNVPKVTGFLGPQNKPQAVSEAEVKRILGTAQEAAASRPRPVISFDIGERVRVVDGPFNDFNGVIEEVNDEKKKLKVTVKIFGRSTPVELNYMQVEKIS